MTTATNRAGNGYLSKQPYAGRALQVTGTSKRKGKIMTEMGELVRSKALSRAVYPTVKIAKGRFEQIKQIGRFNRVIALVRKEMVEGGIDYKLPISSWFDDRGNLCHQNYFVKAWDL